MTPSRDTQELREVKELAVQCGGDLYGDNVIFKHDALLRFYHEARAQERKFVTELKNRP